jgi:formyl-CoA transferase
MMLAARQSTWPIVAKAIGRSDLLADPRFSDAKAISQHAAELAELLDAEFRSQPLAHWKEALDQARIPYGVVHTPEEAAADPQLRAADIVVPIEGARDLEYTVNNPITLRGLDRVPSRRAPEHGEHNDEILAQLGFSVDDIQQLQEQKVIPVAAEQETAK